METKLTGFTRGQSLSDFFIQHNSLRRMAVVGKHSRLTLYCDVINFVMLPARDFWQETVLLLDVM